MGVLQMMGGLALGGIVVYLLGLALIELYGYLGEANRGEEDDE